MTPDEHAGVAAFVRTPPALRSKLARLLGPGLVLGLALTGPGCGRGGERSDRSLPAAASLRIELDERPVWVAEVVERLDAPSYAYLRLAIVFDSADPELAPKSVERWVAIDGAAPRVGARVRVRSLGRRRGVWERTVQREFDTLEYVAVIETIRAGKSSWIARLWW